jgi:hypothetical protein
MAVSVRWPGSDQAVPAHSLPAHMYTFPMEQRCMEVSIEAIRSTVSKRCPDWLGADSRGLRLANRARLGRRRFAPAGGCKVGVVPTCEVWFPGADSTTEWSEISVAFQALVEPVRPAAKSAAKKSEVGRRNSLDYAQRRGINVSTAIRSSVTLQPRGNAWRGRCGVRRP